jgi:hypothetical protein
MSLVKRAGKIIIKNAGKIVVGEATSSPTYSLVADKNTINEGETVMFTLTTTSVEQGTIIPFTAFGLGITQDDFIVGNLSDNFIINNNTASYTFKAKNDATTEGDETMIVALTDFPSVSTSVLILDTSKAPPAYNVTAPASVSEGTTITFTISTIGVPNGSVIPYTISGSAGSLDFDIGGTGNINGGNVTIIADNQLVPLGSATVTFNVKNDVLTEGTENITLTIPVNTLPIQLQPDPLVNVSATVSIVDTSLSINTTLLTLQDSTLIDNSAFNTTLTGYSNVSSSYDSTLGDEIWNFNGSGDYILAPPSSRHSFSVGTPFTIECWVKTSTFNYSGGHARRLFGFATNDANGLQLIFWQSAGTGSSKLSVFTSTALIVGTIPVADGNWHHVALAGTVGSSLKLFVDGVQSGLTYTGGSTQSFNAGLTQTLNIGVYGTKNAGYFNGSISNFRLVNGTNLYPSNFTPPAIPLLNV